jgi:hypothetical protein
MSPFILSEPFNDTELGKVGFTLTPERRDEAENSREGSKAI